MSFKKTCKVCGRVFFSAKYSSKYCSQNCYVKSRNWASQTKHVLESQGDKRHLNDILYNKVCPQCNASFTAKKTNTIFCSQRCGKLYRKTQKDLKEGLKITGLSAVNAAVNNAGSDKKYKILKSCANCGAQFHAMKVTTMFCCSACARKFRRGQDSKERAEKITEDTIRKRVEMRDLASPEAEYLRPEEAARYLGIGLRTLYRYMSDGLISSKQLPGVTVISRSALRAILADDVSLRVRTEDILYDANRYGLQVIFHGCTLPRGWEVMYPNYVSSDAVMASENVYFTEADAEREAFDLCMHPFCRNALATMDWGGIILNRHLSRRRLESGCFGR